ncbi:coil containing protein [Vibrio phage 1.097.O._10N.286.49.B3]|uniref:Coil containing protein n=1 Tax=Vibrio phage 1.097.O._10N.286.49.B3 TaxID=1881383 RepID=A0A2I7R0P7_9CAUD|nr:coil containing protein [Vibrio phage 1.097.O._10N.286.49.B3]AUR87218.1 coil containing protein [Vibrio phage 1.097.O._10N.286.49.B3]
MNLNTLLAGITWFQRQLVKFVEKSEAKNEKATAKADKILTEVEARQCEITKARNIGKNISKLVDGE